MSIWEYVGEFEVPIRLGLGLIAAPLAFFGLGKAIYHAFRMQMDMKPVAFPLHALAPFLLFFDRYFSEVGLRHRRSFAVWIFVGLASLELYYFATDQPSLFCVSDACWQKP